METQPAPLVYAFLGPPNSDLPVVTFVQITFLEYLDKNFLLPQFRPPLIFLKPVVTSSQPTCSVFNISSQLLRTHLICSSHFPWLCPFITSLSSCYRDLPRSISSISSDSTILSSFTGFVGSSLFNISLKCSTHLCSLSRVPVLSTPFLALTPTSRLCHSPVIDLVMLNSSLSSSYLSQQPFPLLQPSSLTNFSNLS